MLRARARARKRQQHLDFTAFIEDRAFLTPFFSSFLSSSGFSAGALPQVRYVRRNFYSHRGRIYYHVSSALAPAAACRLLRRIAERNAQRNLLTTRHPADRELKRGIITSWSPAARETLPLRSSGNAAEISCSAQRRETIYIYIRVHMHERHGVRTIKIFILLMSNKSFYFPNARLLVHV